ncbi:MAG: response regulator [Sphingomonadaceae bacterium]|nr:response regulator [Sphingomonadaceae bacterium]
MTDLPPDKLHHVVVVDDDPKLRNFAADYLRQHGFRVSCAAGGVELRSIIERDAVDIIVLDVMMPGEDGLAIARDLVGLTEIGIIMASALGSETDRIVGLEVGADDYLPKPFSPRELVARIRAVIRRRSVAAQSTQKGNNLLFEGWRCDLVRGMLSDPADVIVALSPGEFALLRVFLEHPQRILSRDQLLEFSRHDDSDAFDRAIDTQVSRLRRKLASRSDAEFIRTVRQEGYMFIPKVVRQ